MESCYPRKALERQGKFSLAAAALSRARRAGPLYKNLHASLLPSSWSLPHQPTWRQVIKQEEGDGWMGRAESHVVP